MTEMDPVGNARHPTAGQVGLHRQEPGTATPESAGPSLNVPLVHAPPKPYVKPVVSHGKGDPLAGLSEAPVRAGLEIPRERKHREMRVSEEDRLRDEIVRTREELGRTVEALALKVDLKGRAQRKMAETRTMAKEKAGAMADRFRPSHGPGQATAGNRAAESEQTTPGGVAGPIMTQARRHPGVIIALGAATVAGAGWLNWAEKHHGRRGLARRGCARAWR